MTILAAQAWPTNGDLIADVAALGYLRPEWRTLDPTFGRGLWWTRFRPESIVAHDLKLDGVDFRNLPEGDASFDAVAFDPPYVSVGGRTTSGIPDFLARYGLAEAPKSPAALQMMIDAGISEIERVLRPGGVLLVKCADYISSGQLWPGTFFTADAGFRVGLRLLDRFEHVAAKPRPQPPGRRQVHARRNLSTLLVFGKP